MDRGAEDNASQQSVEINSRKPPLLQAGGIKRGGGVTRAWRQSYLMEVGNPVGLSSWLEGGGGRATGREAGLLQAGGGLPQASSSSLQALPLLCSAEPKVKSR